MRTILTILAVVIAFNLGRDAGRHDVASAAGPIKPTLTCQTLGGCVR